MALQLTRGMEASHFRYQHCSLKPHLGTGLSDNLFWIFSFSGNLRYFPMPFAKSPGLTFKHLSSKRFSKHTRYFRFLP